MTSRIQEQRFSATATKPANGARPSGELWLNLPDLRLGLIDPAHTAVDLLGVRQYAATSSYALGDYVVHAGDLLRSKAAITPHAFLATDWDTFPTKAANDLLYTTQAQNDIRYYTKAQSDANYYTRTYIDTNFYTRTQSDARYYTQAQTDARYLPLIGGALSGELTVGGTGVHYTQAGGANHGMAFGWDGNIMAWVDGTYVGHLATQDYVNSTEALYLRLTGGTLTGALQVNANTTVLGTLQNSNGRLITYAPNYAPTVTLWQGDTGAMGFWYDGNLNYGQMDSGGAPVAYRGRFRNDGSIEATNRLISANGAFANSSQDFGIYSFSQYRAMQFASNWGWLWDTTNGTIIYWTPAGFPFTIDGSGNVLSGGNIHANGQLQAADATMWMGDGGSGRILQFHSGWYWEWNAGNGDLVWGGPSGAQFWVIRYSDHYCGNQIGPVFGLGGYIDFSDVRAKTDIETAPQGLAEIQKLTPITFKHAGKDRSELGFGAQDVREILPEAVHPVGIPLPDGSGAHDSDDPSLGVSLTPIVAALVNAIKDLATRLEALEGR